MFTLAVKEMAKKMAEIASTILKEATEAAARWRSSQKNRSRIVGGKKVPGPKLVVVVDDDLKQLIQRAQQEMVRITQDRDFPEGALVAIAATSGLKEMLEILVETPALTLPAPG